MQCPQCWRECPDHDVWCPCGHRLEGPSAQTCPQCQRGTLFATVRFGADRMPLISRSCDCGYRFPTTSPSTGRRWWPVIIVLLVIGGGGMLWMRTSPTPTTASAPQRTIVKTVPAGTVYAHENAAGETVEEMENRQGQLIARRFYRPAPPACGHLRSVGLGTDRYWRDDGERRFHCLSPLTPLGSAAEPHGLGLKNNLAYYVDGDAARAHAMLLKLNVNQRQEAKQAHQALVRAAKALTQQALNLPLPKAAEQAITAGKPWRSTLKAATLELAREDWPTGKGYDLKFLVRPAGPIP
jgi:hypothetical protein